MIVCVSLDDGCARKIDNEEDLAWDSTLVFIKFEGDKIFEMDEDGEWNEIR